MKTKKRRLTIGDTEKLLGTFEGENYSEVVRLVRRDIREFKMGTHEAAETCRINRVSPYDVFGSNPAMANQIVDELLRARLLSKIREMGQTK